MIVNAMTLEEYRRLFLKKFRNFGDKSPILISYHETETGVDIIHMNSGKVYSYEWDLAVPVESLIHEIKQDILVHYPRITREEEVVTVLTPGEQAELMASGVSAEKLPSSRTETRTVTYRIDRILAMRDEFILVDEASGRNFCYRMDSSGVFFLKRYREGAFASMDEAGKEFFRKARLLRETTRRA